MRIKLAVRNEILVRELKQNIPLGRAKHKLDDNIETEDKISSARGGGLD
jgi:hypothetical protein